MCVNLVIRSADGRERVFPLSTPRAVIGRETRCDLRVPLPSVAPSHCEILVNDGVIELKDLGSDGGTWHNGDRVERVVLGDRDEFRVGPVTFSVRMGASE